MATPEENFFLVCCGRGSVRRKTKRKKRAEKEKKKKKKRGTWVVDARKWARAPVTPLLLPPQRVRAVLLGRGERPRDEA